MTAVEKLRIIVRVAAPGAFVLTTEGCAELLQEIDRMRTEASETREACARICDERAKSDASNPRSSSIRQEFRSAEAEACAATIRAGGEP